jgi:glutamine amidotransferase-like uncharacterized protein
VADADEQVAGLKEKMTTGRKRVLVFAEHGADHRTLCGRLRETFARAAAPVDVVPVTAAQMREPGMMDGADTIGFFLPGASDANYDNKMGADNIDRLRRFVTDGGRFMGICAGAYYACETIEWFKWDNARFKTKQPRIDFFTYRAHGPIRALLDGQTDLGNGLSHTAAADITFVDDHGTLRRADIMYWGGPELSGASEGHIIARFNNVAGKPPAIVMRDIGQGRALISAVHPEIRGADFAAAVYGREPVHARARDIAYKVAADETARGVLWHGLMRRLFPEYIR